MPRFLLPEGYDPHDMRLKAQFHPKADRMNVILPVRGNPNLCCGAGRNPCRRYAGAGTQHVGYGRCYIHGGRSPGPRTAEGKAKVSKNSTIHGLYAQTLGPEERRVFDDLSALEPTSLENEINMMRAKIVGYLSRQRRQYEDEAARSGDKVAYDKSKVYYSEGENGGRSYYHAATIEDRALDRAMNTLRRLVEAHKRMQNSDDQDDMVAKINAELRAASAGQVTLSWGGKACSDEAEDA